MSYTIVKSDGTVLTTIPDTTINTTATSLGLPGRNYSGYGQAEGTNMVHMLENFAAPTPPPNPLRGQLWFNPTNLTLYVCPKQGESNSQAWLALTATSSGGNTTFGAVTITGNLSTLNASVGNTLSANNMTANTLSVFATANLANANISLANVGTLRTNNITTGGANIPGTLTGTWTVNGSVGNNAMVLNGNLAVNSGFGIKADYFWDTAGNPIPIGGSYGDANVKALLPVYNGNVLGNVVTAKTLTTGSSANAGVITGNWTLSSGSRLESSYADIAERYHSDVEYPPGTVVDIGGEFEITAAVELSENVLGVTSNTAAYLLNSASGADATHPPVALAGRVKVRAIGTVKKGQRLVSAGNGVARVGTPEELTPYNVIGRALEDKNDPAEGHVLAVTVVK